MSYHLYWVAIDASLNEAIRQAGDMIVSHRITFMETKYQLPVQLSAL
jgi:hypothetical protein